MFMISNQFGEAELENKPTRLVHLANFVDEVLRANARNWEENKVFLSHQDLCVKWNATMLRSSSTENNKNKNFQKKRENNAGQTERKPPAYLCKKFNDGKCDIKDDRHPAIWDPTFILKHACNKFVGSKKGFCMESHPRVEHK
jgi:hypothetical protein